MSSRGELGPEQKGPRRGRGLRMCLAIPGQVVDIVDSENHIAKVDVGGVRRNVNIGLLRRSSEGVDIGDWVLIHVGFALSKVDEKEAARTLSMLEGMGKDFEDELQSLLDSRIE
jgi:hydrogenase expression/formation protein HypC